MLKRLITSVTALLILLKQACVVDINYYTPDDIPLYDVKKVGKRISPLSLDQLLDLTASIVEQRLILKTIPRSRSAMLIREFAKKLEMSGPTLLVMESADDMPESRSGRICSYMMTVGELQQMTAQAQQLEGITNMVTDSRNCPSILGLKGKYIRFHDDQENVQTEGNTESVVVDTNMALHVLSTEDSEAYLPIICSYMTMDTDKSLLQSCHISEPNTLVNTGPLGLGMRNDQRFGRFLGTLSTVPIPSMPAAVPSCLHYFETEAQLHVVRSMTPMPHILEVGVVEESELGKSEKIYGMPRSWCVRLGGCSTHNQVCIQVYDQNDHVQCASEQIIGRQDEAFTLRVGIAVEIGLGRVYILDLNKNNLLLKGDATFQGALYPVFGVYSSADDVIVKMKLISGSEISITDRKGKLLCSCLT